ncbi:MAG: hypothetical protein ACREVB_11945 [Burkholderiales bacterium]
MADLEGAGTETLSHLKEVMEQVERAHQKFGALGEKVSQAVSQVQDDWARLGEQVGTFLQAVQEHQGRLSSEVQEAGEALSQLDGAVGEARAEAEGELEAVERQLFAFAALLERGLVLPGARLYDAKRKVNALVRADGAISLGETVGSIHRIGALAQGLEACNGWAFWHLETEKGLVSIDALRGKVRAEMGAG